MNNSYNLIVKDPSHLNYENLHPPAVLTVAIQVTDKPAKGTGPPLNATGVVTINVTDVNEAPDDIRLIPANVTVPENVSIGYCLAQVTSRNPEKAQTVAYTLLNYQNTFSIEDVCQDNSSGASQGGNGLPYLTVKSHLSYNDYVIRGYQLLVEAEDNGIPPQTFNGTVQIHVTEVDPCPWSTCHVDATCSRVDWQNYTCACNEGYSGDGYNCTDTDECLLSPCSHNGTCHDYVNYYNCTCPSGYNNGTDCTFIDFCLSNPCQHGATCNPILNGYNCDCVPGFTGALCETNINECEPKPCVEGTCEDGINRFTCLCEPRQFFGPLCQWKYGECTKDSCEAEEICVPPNLAKYNSTQCISSDSVVSLEFPEDENIASPHWQYTFEQWLSGIMFPLREITNDEYDNNRVNVEDVFVIKPSLEHASKAKRSSTEENPHTLEFVVLVYSDEQKKHLGVPKETVLCGMNNTCLAYRYATTEIPADFHYRLCKVTAATVEYLRIQTCTATEPKDMPLKGQRHSTRMNLYYVTAGIGGILLIVLFTGLILCRRNTLIARERRSMKQQRYRENEDTYTDNMHRHHMANQQMEVEGSMNPIYGTTEEEVPAQIHMSDNPVYQAPDEVRVKRSESTRGFENPMYASFKPVNQDDKEILPEDKAGEASTSVGFSNPMFASYRQVSARDTLFFYTNV